MDYYADFHIHSRFARATSRSLTLPLLDEFARKKGAAVLGTGDFTHPMWFDEIQHLLQPAPEEGLFILKTSNYDNATRFILSVEISSIYQQGGKGRRIHTLVMLPSLEAAANFNRSLEARGAKLSSDGRPIVGLSVKQITELAYAAHPDAMVIPAHAWTPWFGILGSMSGFDSLEECFEELTPKIVAIETGLSSDPAMNWRWGALDNVALISSSDAHSAAKIGREATKFKGEMSYDGMVQALKNGSPNRVAKQPTLQTKLLGTIEFFPEEGKYHFDGHSAHKIRWSPQETKAHKGICTVCGRPVTVGVLSRVEKLADRPENFKPEGAPQFWSLVPLEEIIAEALEVKVGTKKVAASYEVLLQAFDNELTILLDTSIEDIESATNPTIAEGVRHVRAGKLHIEPGYDGEYGTVHVFSPEDREQLNQNEQASLF
ncbi:MAG TPA: endonuclease Q family protein [Candidatus Saccharimonadales bacterium]|nr:endonuclease Q family protein [Candidatus Saccharimonadales bacterium]